MIQFFKKLWSLRPSETLRVFRNISFFKHCDGIKLAIKYGKLYYLENHYVNGQLDIEWRKRAIDDIIHTYQCPVSREEHLASLKELRRGLIQANMDGLIAVNGNPSLSSYEAEQYDKALSSLDYLIAAVKYHPILWRIVFQQPS